MAKATGKRKKTFEKDLCSYCTKYSSLSALYNTLHITLCTQHYVSCQRQSMFFVNGIHPKSMLLLAVAAHTPQLTLELAHTHTHTHHCRQVFCPCNAATHGRKIELVAQRSCLNLLLISLVNTLMT